MGGGGGGIGLVVLLALEVLDVSVGDGCPDWAGPGSWLSNEMLASTGGGSVKAQGFYDQSTYTVTGWSN